METNDKAIGFISRNWAPLAGIIGLVFTLGTLIARFEILRQEFEENKKDQAKNFQLIQLKFEESDRQREEQEERIDALEEYKAWEDGRDGRPFKAD